MPATLYNPDNVVVGHAVLWLAPWVKGAIAPLPADSLPVFDEATGWGGPWVPTGGTQEGFTVNVEASTTKITMEEQSTPVNETLESKGITIAGNLLEDTLETIRLSWGGGSIATGVLTRRSLGLTDNINYYTLGLEMRNLAGKARRIHVPKASVLGSGEVGFRRSAAARMYNLMCTSLCKTTEIQVIDVI